MVLVAAMAGPASAAPAVTCSYSFSAWNGGFTANVDIANNGPTINGWTMRWTFGSPTTNIQAWSSIISENSAFEVVATNMSYNGVIPAGTVRSFGWTATAASTTAPASLTINGTAC